MDASIFPFTYSPLTISDSINLVIRLLKILIHHTQTLHRKFLGDYAIHDDSYQNGANPTFLVSKTTLYGQIKADWQELNIQGIKIFYRLKQLLKTVTSVGCDK